MFARLLRNGTRVRWVYGDNIGLSPQLHSPGYASTGIYQGWRPDLHWPGSGTNRGRSPVDS